MTRCGLVCLILAILAACVRPASQVPNSPAPEQTGSALLSTPPLQPILTDSPPSVPTATRISLTTLPPATPTTVSTTSPTVETQAEELPAEAPVVLIPLSGPIANPEAEISGMAWFSDTLVLLPRYPERFEQSGGGSLFLLEKGEVLDFLEGRITGPLTPRAVSLYAPGISQRIPGFEGFEAITFSGDRIYLTVEASPDATVSYLVSGWYEPGLQAVFVDPDRRVQIDSQSGLPNRGDESLVAFGRRLATVHEANGTAVNSAPRSRLFDQGLALTGELAFPYIEYRIGDATPADENGRFWVINTYEASDQELLPAIDPLVSQYPEGRSHSASLLVERLIELQFTEQGIVFAGSTPIQLELAADGEARHWSALERLDERGFLLATDREPGGEAGTLLAFVPRIP